MLQFILEADARGGKAFKRLAEQMWGSGKPGRWSFPALYLQEFLALPIYTTRSLDFFIFFFRLSFALLTAGNLFFADYPSF